jgi:hypothetical protein
MTVATPTAKRVDSGRRRLWISLALVAAFAITIVAMWRAYQWLESGGVSRIPFNSATWISTPATFDHNSVRQRMVDDLLRSKALNGLTRLEVTALLGPPDKTIYFAGNDFVYMVGRERGFIEIDSEWLIIKLDAAGKVGKARLATD